MVRPSVPERQAGASLSTKSLGLPRLCRVQWPGAVAQLPGYAGPVLAILADECLDRRPEVRQCDSSAYPFSSVQSAHNLPRRWPRPQRDRTSSGHSLNIGPCLWRAPISGVLRMPAG